MSGGPVPAPAHPAGEARLNDRRSSLSRPPQGGLGADPAGISTGSMSGGPVPAPAHPAGEAPGSTPPVEPVETTAGRAGSRPCGHLDRLDERWPGPSPGSPGRGGTGSTTAGRACRDHPQRTLGADPADISTGSMSGGPVPAPAHPAGEAPARPPPVEPVETTAGRAGSRPAGHLDRLDERWPGPSPGSPGRGGTRLDHRRSSLSRPPQRGLGADPADISTGLARSQP